jgi:hypothetical protein
MNNTFFRDGCNVLRGKHVKIHISVVFFIRAKNKFLRTNISEMITTTLFSASYSCMQNVSSVRSGPAHTLRTPKMWKWGCDGEHTRLPCCTCSTSLHLPGWWLHTPLHGHTTHIACPAGYDDERIDYDQIQMFFSHNLSFLLHAGSGFCPDDRSNKLNLNPTLSSSYPPTLNLPAGPDVLVAPSGVQPGRWRDVLPVQR